MTRILQISDTHLVAPPGLVSGRLDTAALLDEAVAALCDRLPKIGPVDALLVTGDLSDDGSAESYALFRRKVEPLGLPLLPIPGNHDLREPMRQAFRDLDLLPAAGRLNWIRDVGDLRVVGLDTLVEGAGGGILDDETLAFIETVLESDRPLLLAMHHPPFMSGIRFMDTIGLAGVDALAGLLRRGSRDSRIVCGHLHLNATGTVGGVPAVVGPSTCSSFDIDFRADAPVGFLTGAGGFMVHDWTDGFRSVLVPPVTGKGPFPF